MNIKICPIILYVENLDTKKMDIQQNENFPFFPLTPRIERLFATKSLHEMIKKSYVLNDDEDADITDIQSSKLWKE